MFGLKKKFTRSRQNSYTEDEFDSPPADYDPNRPPSSWKHPEGPQSPPASATFDHRGDDEGKMYQSATSQQLPYQTQQPQQGSQRNSTSISNANGAVTGRSSRDDFVDVQPIGGQKQAGMTGRDGGLTSGPTSTQQQASAKFEQGLGMSAPDALTRAFHDSIRPYTEKVEGLEAHVQDLQAFVDQLEQERLDIFAWIDERGLRPDVPPSVAKQMDATAGAAEALNRQLDRKITIVNFDLHRLQDDLNDSISSSHFATSMTKFVPDIQRLASIAGGPRFAYDLVIKLVGNLNSHSGVNANRDLVSDAELEEDARARADFYGRMDDELIAIVRARAAEGESWDVQKEVRRFERNAAFLKNIGIETYFPRALDVMKHEAQGGYSGGSTSQAQQGGSPPQYMQK